MYEGKEFTIGGQRWMVPPLSLASLRRLTEAGKADVLRAWSVNPSIEQVDAATDLIYEALRRNYAEITKEQVAGMIDLGNMLPILQTIYGISGLTEKSPGEAGSPSTGAASTGG